MKFIGKTGTILLLLAAAPMGGFSSPGLAKQSVGKTAAANSREAPPLRLIQEIPLPGVQGRLDHFTIDPKRKRVIFSGLGNDSVQVVDAFAGRQIKQIEGLAQPQGALYVPDTDTLYVANSADGHLNIYNGTTFDLIKRIDFGPGSDRITCGTMRRQRRSTSVTARGRLPRSMPRRMNMSAMTSSSRRIPRDSSWSRTAAGSSST